MSLITQLWQQLKNYQQASRWFIGFSGGMDSTVLLHLLVKLKEQYPLPELTAIYIHHGLQTIAESWPAHCQKICDDVNIPLIIIEVNIEKQASLEQAAREARYSAFSQLLQKDDVLLTAQHQNDQAETLLFRLVRGSGVRGLSGIPKSRSFALGILVRPLLETPYKLLEQYAKANSLQWIEDPSNQNTHYARNYLRHEIIPKLQQYWPKAINNITKATTHLQEAQTLLNDLALQDLIPTQVPYAYSWLTIPNLLLEPLTSLSWARQKNALSFWLANHTLMPATEHWQGWHDLITAKESAMPIWKLHKAEIHRSGGRIWLLKDNWLSQPSVIKLPVISQQEITLTNNGTVKIIGVLPENPLFIRYRQGGEIIQLANRGHRDLKRLLNEYAIPPFIRTRLPLLVDQQDTLVAIANFPEWQDKKILEQFTFNWQMNQKI